MTEKMISFLRHMNIENIGTEAIINKQGAAVAFIGTARTVY